MRIRWIDIDLHRLFIGCRQMAMIVSLIESNPQLMQQMGRSFQQVLVEVQRIEKLAKLKVCLHFC